MAAAAQTTPTPVSPLAWFRNFLKEELTAYWGRTALVARMTIAATLVMIITMTFRLPEGAYGAIYAITISRESVRGTFDAVKTMAIAFAIASAYELIGARFFVNDPTLRLVWLVATFLLMFYALSALANYTAAVRFGYLVIITTPIWDSHVPASAKVEGTLWAVWTITVASLITAFVELLFTRLTRGHDFVVPIVERLTAIEDLLLSYSGAKPMDKAAETNITRVAMVGISRLRRNLQRSGSGPQHREQMGAVLALVGRLVDLAATLTDPSGPFSDDERKEMRSLAEQITSIRIALERGELPRNADFLVQNDSPPYGPLLQEMQTTVTLIREVFAGTHSLEAYAPSASGDSTSPALFRQDALSNSDHFKFALRGCLAASLCYIIYNAVDWSGISTAVTTCFLTAQTTIGASRQKQMLRVAGALIGGVGMAMGAQVFVLPYVGSIAGFTVLFMVVTIVAAWIATSSARLSYLGVQIAVGFYLINLQEFKFQTSLAVARDRIAGILLGLLVMWLVFDQIWSATAGVETRRAFIENLRLLAQFAREPVSTDRRGAIERSYSLRESINNSFDKVRSLADGVLFEFGPSRQEDLALRERIRWLQPQFRMVFLTQVTLLKYALNLPGFELPQSVALIQRQFDNNAAKILDDMANRLDGKPSEERRREDLANALNRLEEAAEMSRAEQSQPARTPQLQSLLALARRMESLIISVDNAI